MIGAAMRTTLAAARVPGAGGQVLRGTLNGLWLGVLSDAQLRALDERYYDREDTYRTAAWNERGLFFWEAPEVERSFPAGARVVVIACGGGREVLGLLRAGYDAVGYESHPALAEYAERFLAGHGFAGHAHAIARDSFPAGEACDAVIVGWGAYALIASRAARVALLRAMPAGVPVLLSFFERPAHGRELRLTLRLARTARRLRGSTPLELGDTLAPNRVHVFTRAELEDEVAEAGRRLAVYHVIGPADPRTGYAYAVVR